MKRLVLGSFTAALVAAGSVFAISPASAAPATATCKPGVIIAISHTVSPHVVRAGHPMRVSDSVSNCTAKSLVVMLRIIHRVPAACGPSSSTMIGPLVMKPHQQQAGAGGGQAPSCLGRYTDSEVISMHGKVVARAVSSYLVIK